MRVNISKSTEALINITMLRWEMSPNGRCPQVPFC